MFYTIKVTPVMRGVRKESQTLAHFLSLASAKTCLMDWAQSLLKRGPDRRYSEEPVEGHGSRTVMKVRIAAPASSNGMEGVILRGTFDDEHHDGFVAQMHRLTYAAKKAVDEALARGESVEIPYERDEEETENVKVLAIGNHGDFYVALTAVGKDAEGKLYVSAVGEDDGLPYERIEEYDLVNTEWPYIADVVLGIKARKEVAHED